MSDQHNTKYKISNSFFNNNDGPYILQKDLSYFIKFPYGLCDIQEETKETIEIKDLTEMEKDKLRRKFSINKDKDLKKVCFSLNWTDRIAKIEIDKTDFFSNDSIRRNSFLEKLNEFIGQPGDPNTATGLYRLKENNVFKAGIEGIKIIVDEILKVLSGSFSIENITEMRKIENDEFKIKDNPDENEFFSLDWENPKENSNPKRPDAVIILNPFYIFRFNLNPYKVELKATEVICEGLRNSIAVFKGKLYELDEMYEKEGLEKRVLTEGAVETIINRIHLLLFTQFDTYVSGVANKDIAGLENITCGSCYGTGNGDNNGEREEDCVDSGNIDISLCWKEISGNIYARVKVATEKLFSDKRKEFKESFFKFRKELENLEQNGTLIHGGADIVAERVASSLPLRFDDVLQFYYGLNKNIQGSTASDNFNYIELKPGMRLVVEYGAYQYLAPEGFAGSQLNNFVANGQCIYYITKDKENRISFNRCMDELRPFRIEAQDIVKAAGIIDLTEPTYKRVYCRLIYPTQFINVSNISQEQGIDRNMTLLTADTLEDLEKMTEQYINKEQISIPDYTGENPPLCIYFNGRTIAFPEILVIVKGNPVYVPLGFNVRDIIERYHVIAPDQINNEELSTFNVEVKRWNQSSIWNPGYGIKAKHIIYEQNPIAFQCKPGIFQTTALDQWDLPLVKGDEIKW